MGRRREATGAAERRRGGPRQIGTTGAHLEEKSAMVLCDVKSCEESGLPTLPEIPVGNLATAAQVWIETDLGGPTGNQIPLQQAKTPTPHYRLSEYPTKPKAREDTSQLRPPWRGERPSDGGGGVLRDRWTGDGKQLSGCV
jgi:hypothetical protein